MELGHHGGAVELLRESCVEAGIVASSEPRANYRRIWARDAVVCGLAGVAIADETICNGLARSLDRLCAALGPHGEVPSNVPAETRGEVSYGSLAGRLDSGAWLAIGAYHVPGDASRFEQAVRGAFDLYERWELNTRGLVYSPMGGGWADEYLLHGYTLTEQLLRLWALRLWNETEHAARLQRLIEDNYWVGPETEDADHYHPVAYRRAAGSNPPRHWVAAFHPGGYELRFDALANALAILLSIGTPEQRLDAALAGLAARDSSGGELVPAFWPVIADDHPEFKTLEALCTHEFRNHPGHYHNGGSWPMVAGFFAAALRTVGRAAEADRMASGIAVANQQSPTTEPGDDFYEYHSRGGGPAGVRRCSWSAAGELLANGPALDFGVSA